jgi:cytochrome b561
MYDNGELIKEKLLELNVNLTIDQSRDVAGVISHGLWDWHIYFGYLFAILLVVRMVMVFKSGFDYPKDTSTHKKIVYLGYKVLYVLLIVIAITGVFLHQEELFGFTESTLEIFEELHGIFANLVMIFIPLHIIGVVVTDIKEDKGLVSRIISGDK